MPGDEEVGMGVILSGRRKNVCLAIEWLVTFTKKLQNSYLLSCSCSVFQV